MAKLKQLYEPLAKKHRLPSYADLNREFEVDGEEPDFPLAYVRRKICEKLDAYAKVLEDLMHPESTITSLYECKILDDAGKEQVFTLYRRLMHLLRHALVVALSAKEADDAAFIRQAYAAWPAIKKDYLPVAAALRDVWENDTDIKEQLEYFG